MIIIIMNMIITVIMIITMIMIIIIIIIINMIAVVTMEAEARTDAAAPSASLLELPTPTFAKVRCSKKQNKPKQCLVIVIVRVCLTEFFHVYEIQKWQEIVSSQCPPSSTVFD